MHVVVIAPGVVLNLIHREPQVWINIKNAVEHIDAEVGKPIRYFVISFDYFFVELGSIIIFKR